MQGWFLLSELNFSVVRPPYPTLMSPVNHYGISTPKILVGCRAHARRANTPKIGKSGSLMGEHLRPLPPVVVHPVIPVDLVGMVEEATTTIQTFGRLWILKGPKLVVNASKNYMHDPPGFLHFHAV